MGTCSSRSLLGISFLASLVATGTGCAASSPHLATEPAVEVGSHAQLDAPLARVGELTMRRAAKVATAKQAQQRTEDEAAEWTDCSRGAKVCTAKGFVYDKVSPAMPDINAHAAPPSEVAHR